MLSSQPAKYLNPNSFDDLNPPQLIGADGMSLLEKRRWIVITHLVNQFVIHHNGADQWPVEINRVAVAQAFTVRVLSANLRAFDAC